MNPPPPTRRCWAEIDLGALRHNVAAARGQLAPGVRIMAVVKANAYGHGLRGVAEALAGDVEMFGVANVAEAEELQSYVEELPIFILGPALPDERPRIVAGRFVPAISTVEEARDYAQLAGAKPLSVHLNIDTGMGRVGILEKDALEVTREILSLRGINVTGLASHLPVADEDESFTREQLERFHSIVAQLRAIGVTQPVRSTPRTAPGSSPSQRSPATWCARG